MEKLISVIIITKDRPNEVIKAIESIKSASICQDQIEIIVYDNNDDFNTVNIINSKCYENVMILGTGQGNKGVTVSRNIAAMASVGKYLYFMDDDSWVDPEMFDILLYAFKTQKNLFSAVPHIRFIRDDEYLGPTPSECIDPPYYYSPATCEAAVLVDREKYFIVGGWNESIFFGGEGVDLSLRAFYHGFYGVMCKKAIAFHPSNQKITKKQSLSSDDFSRTVDSICSQSNRVMSSWPIIPAFFYIFKNVWVTGVKAAISYRSLSLWKKVFKTSLISIFQTSRYKHISYKRWFRYRKLSQMPKIELHIEEQDYTHFIFCGIND